MSRDAVDDRLAPVIRSIAESAVDRERERRLPIDEVAALRAAGFGALRVPVEFGGAGVSLERLFRVLIELGEADPNLPQLLRGHVAFVETQLGRPAGGRRDDWLRRIGSGDVLFGNAQAERGDATAVSTTLEPHGDALLLNGRKYYSTGTLFADWIWSGATLGDEHVAFAVRADAPGVTRHDDWTGFGQRLTGSGTTVFENVLVDPADVLRWTENDETRSLSYTHGLYQLVLLASLAGIARAVLRDAVAFVRPRTRTFGVPGRSSPRDDAVVQSVVGRLGALRFSVEATVLEAVRRLERADADRHADPAHADIGDDAGREEDAERYHVALVAVFEAQQIVIEQVLEATGLLFEVGGASAVERDLALDRHWRNARTIASHNPAVHRTRAVGDFHLNGTLPVSMLLPPRVNAGGRAEPAPVG